MVQTPRLKGLLFNAGDFDFTLGTDRPLRTNWLTVGIHTSHISNHFGFIRFEGVSNSA